MNYFLEKAIAHVAPQTALKREVARQQLSVMTKINSGYGNHGASHQKKSMRGWNYSGGSPKEDIEDNIPTLRERCRDMYMGGAPLATGSIKTMRTNVVGSGLVPKPNIDYEFLGLTEEESEKLEEQIKREYDLWANSPNCDMARLNNFAGLQQIAFLSWLLNGDTFALLPYKKRVNTPYDLRVQLIEADRVCNPSVFDTNRDISAGVEVDRDGEVIAYHIANFHPLAMSTVAMQNRIWTRVEAYGKKTGRRNVIHCMESERIGQRRGVPILAPVIEQLKQLGRYTEAELMGSVVAAMFTVFVKSQNPASDPFANSIDDDERVDDDDENSYELAPGSVAVLAPGEDVEIANPSRPNSAFGNFINIICQQIGAAIEIPPELLLKQFGSNYSASRAALLEAWKMFRMRRSWLANDFCQPIYEEFLTEAVAKGRINAPGFLADPLVKNAYCKCDWNGPSQGQIDPLKEANASAKLIEEGLSTRERETVELGKGDFKTNHKQRVREERMRREGNVIITEKTAEGGEKEDEED